MKLIKNKTIVDLTLKEIVLYNIYDRSEAYGKVKECKYNVDASFLQEAKQ
jgi:hypothetical protein